MGVDPYAHLSLAEDLRTAADFIRTTALHSSSEIMLSFACHIEARLAHVEKQEQPSYLRSGFDVYRALTGPLSPASRAFGGCGMVDCPQPEPHTHQGRCLHPKPGDGSCDNCRAADAGPAGPSGGDGERQTKET